MHPYELSGADAAHLISSKQLSSEELTRSCLDRIAERDSDIRAWVTIDPAQAICHARELDKHLMSGRPIGPLHGLPFGVKDVIDTVDFPTQHNSRIYIGHRPSQDAAAVSVVKSQGAYVIGKTDTVEFASIGRKALTRNPRDLTRTPGGSSSGSAAAVADFHVPIALGTQTAGSLIRPASFNGIYGFKPTCNVVPWSGTRQLSPSLDTIGWYGRSAKDLTLVAKAFRLRGTESAITAQVKGLKIGLAHTHNASAAEPCAREALDLAARRLVESGAIVTEVTFDSDFSLLNRAQTAITNWESRSQFLPEYLSRYEDLDQAFREKVEGRDEVSEEEIRMLYDTAYRCRAKFDALFGGTFNALLTYAATGEAPIGLYSTGDWIMNSMWTMLSAPCMSIPCYHGQNGMPVGVQIVGPRWADDRLLAVGEAVAPIIDIP